MLARIFGYINSSTNILLVLYALILTSSHFLLSDHPKFIFETNWANFQFVTLAGYAISFGLMLLISFYAQWLLEYKYKLVKRHAFLPFFLMTILMLFSVDGNLNLLITILYLLILISSWFSVYQGEKLLPRALNTGLLLGFGSILDTRISILIVFSMIVYLIYGRLNLRSLFILIIGFLTIWLDALALEYIVFDTTSTYQYFTSIFSITKPFGAMVESYLPLGFVLILLILGLTELPKTLSRANVFKRQSYIVVMSLLLLGVIGFLVLTQSVFQMAILIICTCILFVNFFQYLQKIWIKEAIMWVSIAFIIVAELNLI